MPTIADIWSALDWLAAAARTNNHNEYQAAYTHAGRLGCTPDQIKDAFCWGLLRRYVSPQIPPVVFTWTGELREA